MSRSAARPGRRARRRSEDAAARPPGSATHGKSKDSRDDLPQVVIGMAVTRDGIPVRVLVLARATPPTPA